MLNFSSTPNINIQLLLQHKTARTQATRSRRSTCNGLMERPLQTAKAPQASCSAKRATRSPTSEPSNEAFCASHWSPTGLPRAPSASVCCAPYTSRSNEYSTVNHAFILYKCTYHTLATCPDPVSTLLPNINAAYASGFTPPSNTSFVSGQTLVLICKTGYTWVDSTDTLVTQNASCLSGGVWNSPNCTCMQINSIYTY